MPHALERHTSTSLLQLSETAQSPEFNGFALSRVAAAAGPPSSRRYLAKSAPIRSKSRGSILGMEVVQRWPAALHVEALVASRLDQLQDARWPLIDPERMRQVAGQVDERSRSRLVCLTVADQGQLAFEDPEGFVLLVVDMQRRGETGCQLI